MTDLPPLKLDLGELSRVDGSARFASGSVIALASVTGPIDVRSGWEKPEEAFLEVNVRPLEGVPGTQAKSIAQTLKSALTPSLLLGRAPRTLIQLTLQALSPSSLPSNFAQPQISLCGKAAMMNAATAAFLDAGSVSMRGIVCACAVGTRNGGLVLDPTEKEETGAFGFLFRGTVSGELVWAEWEGEEGDWEKVAREARTGAEIVRDFIRAQFERAAGLAQEDEVMI
ncbi:hypothetical protein DACRYDRAFT_117939 [Dacryopinax primogenitus]|uniref:Exoribonuclease phosphorolytic domain-containing protein n=1 Tax=Dacryopinax primogenitus (strain DJM 731) TaxID=1858805 RepID=M5FRJ6_DACPD|nr:uncharacterized protein DACRYDRAFT_117939 [Dacryopinax primogenitus]EJT99775.1 hypothetical protein DACRYDRAFT_117939 [Dacryopinax primogenitus]